MKSKWCELKGQAIALRRKGVSFREIEKRLGIARSTLSGWLRGVKLSSRQQEKLGTTSKQALMKAREKAVLWHNEQKRIRIEDAKRQALQTLQNIDVQSFPVQELALALLYLGEGRKKAGDTSLGSTDPLILKFFLAVLRGVYKVDDSKIRCSLYLRADQDGEVLKRQWARELGLPLNSFVQVYKDKRTAGSKSYSEYKGVCDVRCGDISIKRKMLFLSRFFCERISNGILGL